MIFIKTHLIMSVRAGDVMEDFSTADETQNEAVQLIAEFLADEEGFQSLEAERKADVGEEQLGPRRIELVIQEKNTSRTPAVQKRIVVTSLLEPSGKFASYFLTGREWRSLEKRDLSKIRTTTNSDAVDILEMFIYDAGSIYKEEREPFSTEITKQQTAWRRACREFNRIGEPEKMQLDAWDGIVGMPPVVIKAATSHYPDIDSDDFEVYGYSGWMPRTPSTYKPSPPHKAYFRRAGDSVGCELLRKHEENLLTAKLEIVVVSDPVPETVPAETREDAEVSKSNLPIVFTPEPDFRQCYCGMAGCDNCHLTSILTGINKKEHRRYDIH
jgi:hypothetical protein